MGAVVELNRSLDQELHALVRGASLECLVCGEFVLRLPDGSIFCPGVRLLARSGRCRSGLQSGCRPGDRGLASGD